MWKVLAGEEGILHRVFAHLLEVLNLSLPYQERNKGNKIVHYATDVPQSVSYSLEYRVTCEWPRPSAGYQGGVRIVYSGGDWTSSKEIVFQNSVCSHLAYWS